MKNSFWFALVMAICFLTGAAAAQTPASPGGSLPAWVLISSGVAQKIDTTKKEISYSYDRPGTENPFGVGSVTVSDSTVITTQKYVKLAELKVGDTVVVRGIPLVMSASQLNAGDAPDDLGDLQATSQMRIEPVPDGVSFPFGKFGPLYQGDRINKSHPSFAEAVGKIVHLKPLTVSFAEGTQLILNVAPYAEITKMAPAQFSDIKVDDRILMITDEQGTTPGEWKSSLRRLEILLPVLPPSKNIPARVKVLQPSQLTK